MRHLEYHSNIWTRGIPPASPVSIYLPEIQVIPAISVPHVSATLDAYMLSRVLHSFRAQPFGTTTAPLVQCSTVKCNIRLNLVKTSCKRVSILLILWSTRLLVYMYCSNSRDDTMPYAMLNSSAITLLRWRIPGIHS